MCSCSNSPSKKSSVGFRSDSRHPLTASLIIQLCLCDIDQNLPGVGHHLLSFHSGISCKIFLIDNGQIQEDTQAKLLDLHRELVPDGPSLDNSSTN